MQKRVLVFSHKLPYPLTQGGAIAQFFFLEKLVKFYDITFCTVVSNENQKNNLKSLQSKLPDLNIEFYERKIQKRTLLQVIHKYFLRVKARIKKIVKNTSSLEKEMQNNILPALLDKKLFDFLNDLISKKSFDLVQFDFYEALVLVPALPDNIKKVFVHHEIRSKRNELLNKGNDKYLDYLINCEEIFENALLEKFDSVIVFNEEDKNYLKDINKPVHISAFGIPEELIQKKETSQEFKKFIFIGGEFHYPNKEGLEWFLDTIFIPNYNHIDWPIYIIGYWSKNIVDKYSSNKKIIFCGYVSDLNEFYNESVMIVPVLSGSGIRTKILMSLANKVPVFSTEFASEGLLLNNEVSNHISLFNSASEFMEIFSNSANNEFLISLANNGFEFYNNHFHKSTLISNRLKVWEDVLHNS
ncbi:hypothetical protein B4N84_14280 [Flavobacterium sp. IR1]|nr:hypothetical protein B4N84_14280 [Flavobacterium sp. IR1]